MKTPKIVEYCGLLGFIDATTQLENMTARVTHPHMAVDRATQFLCGKGEHPFDHFSTETIDRCINEYVKRFNAVLQGK